MNEAIAIPTEGAETWRPSAALNPHRLEYLWQLTDRIAWSTSVPETLCGVRTGTGANSTFERFDDRVILANVFAVVEQADRWNISPFALLGAAAIVRGKLTFEGKVINAVLESQFGVKLFTYFRGTPRTDEYQIYLCDEELPDEILAELKPGYRHDRFKILDGSVAAWKTSGGTWRPDTFTDMLVYRGSRQWARVYKPAAILGVIADDEAQQMLLEHNAQAATPVAQRFAAPQGQGFNAASVAAQLEDKSLLPMEIIKADDKVKEEIKSEAQSGGDALKTTVATNGDEPKASATPADKSVGGTGSTVPDGSQSQSTTTTGSEAKPVVEHIRVTAEIFRDYHSALARVESKEGVGKNHAQFWKGKGIKITHPDDLQLAKDIKENHELRAEGKIPAAKLAHEIDGWIQKVTGGLL